MNGEERQIRLITYKISKIYHVWLELANAPSNFWLGLKSASSADNYLSVSFAALITEFSKHQSEFDCILHLETSIFSPPLKALICIRILMVHTSSLNWVSCCSSKLKKSSTIIRSWRSYHLYFWHQEGLSLFQHRSDHPRRSQPKIINWKIIGGKIVQLRNQKYPSAQPSW